MPRSEITAMVQRARDMVEYVREKLTDEELKVFLDELAPLPEPEPVKVAKKTCKKSSKSATKSPRGQSLSNAIQRTPKARVGDSDNGDASGQCSDCGMAADMPIHDPDGGYLNYYPFVSAAAQPARGRSSTNGGVGNSTASIETGKAAAGVTAGGSNE